MSKSPHRKLVEIRDSLGTLANIFCEYMQWYLNTTNGSQVAICGMQISGENGPLFHAFHKAVTCTHIVGNANTHLFCSVVVREHFPAWQMFGVSYILCEERWYGKQHNVISGGFLSRVFTWAKYEKGADWIQEILYRYCEALQKSIHE